MQGFQESAYRAYHSTTALVDMTERWLDDTKDKKQNMSTFLDLRTAFNCKEYSTLVDKMTVYSISAKSTGLIRNYIVGRRRVVTIGTRNSSHWAIKCGTPQVSNLGPILYNLDSQDFLAYLHTNCQHKKGNIGMAPSRDQELICLNSR